MPDLKDWRASQRDLICLSTPGRSLHTDGRNTPPSPKAVQRCTELNAFPASPFTPPQSNQCLSGFQFTLADPMLPERWGLGVMTGRPALRLTWASCLPGIPHPGLHSLSLSLACYTLPVRRPGAPRPEPCGAAVERSDGDVVTNRWFRSRRACGLWADCSRVQAQSQQGKLCIQHKAADNAPILCDCDSAHCCRHHVGSLHCWIAVWEKSSGTERSYRTANSGGFKMQAQPVFLSDIRPISNI